MESAKAENAAVKGMSLTDTEILDRISEVKAEVTESVGQVRVQVAALHTKIDTLIAGKDRCNDHAKRLADVEQTLAADKRVRGFVYAALTLGIPAITALVIAIMQAV